MVLIIYIKDVYNLTNWYQDSGVPRYGNKGMGNAKTISIQLYWEKINHHASDGFVRIYCYLGER